MPEVRTAEHIIYCDGCHDLLQKGEQYIQAGGKLWCLSCWGEAR